MVQWLRIHLAVQGTPVPPLVLEDSTYCGATRSVGHNYCTCALEYGNCNYGSPHAWASQQGKPPQQEAHAPQQESSSCSLQLEKVPAQQQRISTANK